MAVIKCKMCGGDIELSADKTFGTCEFCGSTMTFPKVDDDQRAAAFNRGNHFRRIGEFDKALAVYERIIREDDTDAEAHWCCALCRFGIEYVEDPTTYEWIPTCHRASFDSFLEDVDYLAALEHSDGITRRQYQKDGAKIAEVQKGILATSQNEDPFDVFICYKESDENGDRTRDSLMAQDIYYQLTDQGYRVFFARITLEDMAGREYEPYIFAALNSAKVMIVVGTKAEHLNAVWVKNEWSRFLAMMKKDRHKLLLPCYRDMDPYDMPEQLTVLQSYDMGKIGFIQDLSRGIAKVLDADKKPETVKKTVVIQQAGDSAVNIDTLLKRVFMFLEDGDWQGADEYCEKILDIDPENARAYLGKLMAENHVRKQEGLKNCPQVFDTSKNYQKVMRFGEKDLKTDLQGYVKHIKDRNEADRLSDLYQKAKKTMDCEKTEETYKEAARLFESIQSYKDSGALAVQCIELAKICAEKKETDRKDRILDQAKAKMADDDLESYDQAIKLLKSIPGWKNADELAKSCEEGFAQAEQRAQKASRNLARIIKGILVLVLLGIAYLVAVTWVIPAVQYHKAEGLLDDGQLDEARGIFLQLGDYQDSAERAKYLEAMDLMAKGQYYEASSVFALLKDYKDSAAKKAECDTIILEAGYATAVALMEEGKYEEAIAAFTALHGYKDSDVQIDACRTVILDGKYAEALELLDAGKYSEAMTAFEALDGYKDSEEKAQSIYEQYIVEKPIVVEVGDSVFFGAYEQDNNTSNGKEEIEWLVLEVKEGMALVISKYALDSQPYQWGLASYPDNLTWETCTLREWLNNDFIDAAFSADEKAMIQTVTVPADENPESSVYQGNATQDQVFLLSIREANGYFSSDGARQCEPTDYAVAKGAYADSSNHCLWWLRTNGYKYIDWGNDSATYVNYDGDVFEVGNDMTEVYYTAVRPALWIDPSQLENVG